MIKKVLGWMFIVALVGGSGFDLGTKIYTRFTEHQPEVRVEVESRTRQITRYIRCRSSTIPVEFAQIIAQNIVGVAQEKKVPVDLLIGIIEKESIWNAGAVSSAGARGLMQILRAENVEVDVEQAHNIHYNLSTGAEILSGKIKIAQGDLNLALSNYSGGAEDYTNEVLARMGRWLLYTQSKKED